MVLSITELLGMSITFVIGDTALVGTLQGYNDELFKIQDADGAHVFITRRAVDLFYPTPKEE